MSEERLVTMPQEDDEGRLVTLPQEDEERLVTLPQEDEERLVTLPHEDEERLVTLSQGDEGRLVTLPQDNEERTTTLPQDSEDRLTTLPQRSTVTESSSSNALVKKNITFGGKLGGNFEILSDSVISIGTGEAQIYLCSKHGEDKKFVAKVLTSITPESGIEIRHNRDKVIEFLLSINENANTHVLPLVDTGSIQIDGSEYYVDVYPFCDGGDLGANAPLDYSDIEKNVIPAINTALHTFHEAGFVHRDLKPDNLYRYNGKVVIGDFGITCSLREDGFAIDKKKTGTLGYYAPELMSQAAVVESDYYSLGQTLWTLLRGRPMYGNLIRRFKAQGPNEQRIQVNNAMMNSDYPDLDTFEFDDNNKFFSVLIRGLLQYDPKSRFDYAKVNRWIKGDQALVHEIDRFQSKETFTKPFTVLGVNCWNSKDVANSLCRNWNLAMNLLYSGELSKTYPEEQGADIRFIFSIENRYGSNRNYSRNTGLTDLILHLSHFSVLCVDGKSMTRDNEVSQLAVNAVREPNDSFHEVITTELLKDWYIRRPTCNEPMIIALDHISGLLENGDMECERIAYNWLSLITQEGGEGISIDGCVNLDAFVKKILGSRNRLYEEAIPYNPIVTSTLCYWGYYRNVRDIISAGKPFERFDLLLKMFESETSDEVKPIVRDFYYNFGPLAQYSWWKNNIGIYEYAGAKAEALINKITNVTFGKTDLISTQIKGFKILSECYREFGQYFETDLMMTTLGIKFMRSDSYICTENIKGFWEYSFLESAAPIGFKYYLGM